MTYGFKVKSDDNGNLEIFASYGTLPMNAEWQVNGHSMYVAPSEPDAVRPYDGTEEHSISTVVIFNGGLSVSGHGRMSRTIAPVQADDAS